MIKVIVGTGESAVVKVNSGQPTTPISVGNSTVVLGNIETYSGEYDVTPEISKEVVLETANKRMNDDVTVRKVPLYRTSNETGTTVYIGRKVDG